MAPKMKRPAAAGASAAKRAKVAPELMHKCHSIADALKDAEAYPASVRAVLTHAVKPCMTILKDDRSDFDNTIVEQIEAVLASKKSSMEAAIAAHQGTVDSADSTKAGLEAAVGEATATLETLKSATAEASTLASASAEAAKESKVALAAVTKANDEGNVAYLAVEKKKTGLESIFKDSFLRLKEAAADPPTLKVLDKTCKTYAFDASLTNSAFETLKKLPEARSEFDKVVLGQLEDAFTKQLADISTELEGLTPAMNERKAALQAKEEEHTAADAKAAETKEAYNNAKTAEKEGEKELASKKKAADGHLFEIKKAADNLDASTSALKQFMIGAMQAFEELKVLAPPPPPPAEPEPQTEETVPVETPAAEGAPAEAPTA